MDVLSQHHTLRTPTTAAAPAVTLAHEGRNGTPTRRARSASSPTAGFEPPVTDKASGWDFEGIRSDDLTPCAAAQTTRKRLVRREWGIGRSMNEVSSDEELSDMPVLERLLGDTFSQEEYSTNAAASQDHVVEEGKECRAC